MDEGIELLTEDSKKADGSREPDSVAVGKEELQLNRRTDQLMGGEKEAKGGAAGVASLLESNADLMKRFVWDPTPAVKVQQVEIFLVSWPVF